MDDRPTLWRSLDDEAAPAAASVAAPLSRRDFLKLSAAATALAAAGCQAPAEEIVARTAPEEIPEGVPRYFATAVTLAGCAEGVLVETNGGRPTKVEGNPAHPSSLGATSVFAQAEILELWNPQRSRTPRRRGQVATRARFETELREQLQAAADGEGVHVLARYSSSPTLAAQARALAARLPGARWHTWEPLHRDFALEGARLAFGRAVDTLHRFENADTVVAIDADFVGAGPGHLRHAREAAMRRRPSAAGPMSRIYAVESMPSLAGAFADHRLALAPEATASWLAELAAALRGGARPGSPLLAAAARDLATHRGRGIVIAGDRVPAQAQALVHRLNAELGNAGSTVTYIEPVCGDAGCVESLAGLTDAMRRGLVRVLVILGGNPCYDAPADSGFSELLGRVAFSVHHALYENETSALCTWHVPRAHAFEEWSDARGHDGTATLMQPVVAPLYGGVALHEMVALLTPEGAGSARDIVRARWRSSADADFEAFWRASLREGIVRGSAAPALAPAARAVQFAPPPAKPGWRIAFRADESVHDGELAGNAWLQELPRPQSKVTWDNAAYASARSAAEIGAKSGDVIEIAVSGRKLRAPLWVLPGHADGTITLPLGYGRARAPAPGARVGFDAYALRDAGSPWSTGADSVERTAARHAFASTQGHGRMEGRDPVRRATLADLLAGRLARDDAAPAESLYPAWRYDSYRWAMAIDLGACIGCNACTIACQAENNVPAVGKEEVARGREMHWIRVDRYYDGEADRPRIYFQPVPCMQCENAPCEAVCPVGATVHDSEGINVQVYNRCVGTRFCSNNCPYKVRRFNFLHFSAGAGEPPIEGRNPEVTVRMRGVMEKCNYCLQRITRARIETEKQGRRIADGEVVTACQAVCPTRAITFGDLSDPASAVNAAKDSPLGYALLNELNTRPRTTYLARLANPDETAA